MGNGWNLPPGEKLNMVLVGKTGQGKSDTGNTILEQNVFRASDSVSSETSKNASFEKKIGGRVLNVVDTPGCMDTEKGDEILKEIADAVTLHPEGYDAFLIVVKYPLRMTQEEVTTIMQLEEMFGPEIYTYAVVIFTHGDAFEAKQRKSNAPITFEQYARRDLCSGGKDTLGPLFRQVGGRMLLFNNMEQNEWKRREMVINLVKQIDANGMKQRYDNHIFQKARQLQKVSDCSVERAKLLTTYLKENARCKVM